MLLTLLFSLSLYASNKGCIKGDIKKLNEEIREIYINHEMLWKRLSLEEKQELKKRLPEEPGLKLWLK